MTCASRTEIHQNWILKVDLLVKNWLENVTMTKLVLLKHFITEKVSLINKKMIKLFVSYCVSKHISIKIHI